MEDSFMSFVTSDILSKLGSLSKNDADNASFGIVQLDSQGKIMLYNRWEANFAGLQEAAVQGKNFFTEVALCTNNKLVFGRFKSGIETTSLDVEMNYTFTYKMKPTNVALHLLHDKPTGTNWIFVNKR
jgi:photoactive yellow protein